MSNLFDIKMVFTQIPDLLTYLPVTLELAVVAMIVSLILGLILALIKMKKIPVLKQIANLYISVIRGTPVLVQLYVTYFGIPMILKAINLKYGTNYNANGVAPIIYAFIALAVNESAYNAEVIRASLESVPKGQIEAANALGMTYFQALRRVILPEAIVVALPSLGNSFIGLIKGTSLAFVCAVVEMTAAGKIIAGRTYRYFEVYVSLAIIYWIITIIVEQGIKLIEKKIRIPENAPAIQTSALDPELVGEVLDTIKKAANEGYTMLLVSHEMNFVKNVATRVIFLENGKIIEDGPPKEVFNHPKSDRVREFFAKINRMVEPEYSI